MMSFNELRPRGTADFPIELYEVDKTDSRYEMVSHWHTEFEIIKIKKGRLDIKLNNKNIRAVEGDVVLVCPESVHGATPLECEYECIDFGLDYLSVYCEGCCHFFDGLIHGEYIIDEVITPRRKSIYDVVERLFDLMKKKSKGYKFKVIGALYQLFGEIVDEHIYFHIIDGAEVTENKSVQKLKTVLSYMRENYDKSITLSDMANAADMSPKYLCYFFKEMTQKTPVEYLTTYRIEKASRKLINTGMSVTEIAFACGFNDLSYFIKTFKEYKGITPSKYRRA